jgi:hypothetical protein
MRSGSEVIVLPLFEVGRVGGESRGCPNTRPVAAAATAVPIPTSYEMKMTTVSKLRSRRNLWRRIEKTMRS